MMTDRPHIIYNLLKTLLIGMGRVHPDYIHSRFEQTADEIHLTPTVTYTGYYFCLLHTCVFVFSGAKVQKSAQTV